MHLKINTVFLSLVLISSSPGWCTQQGNSDNSASYYKTLSIGVGIGFTAATILWYAVNRSFVKAPRIKDDYDSVEKALEAQSREEYLEVKIKNEHLTQEVKAVREENILLRYRYAECQRGLEACEKEVTSIKTSLHAKQKWYNRWWWH